MKNAIKCSILALSLGFSLCLIGCGHGSSFTLPPMPTAPTIVDPGYYSALDETFAKDLAPLRAFINEEIVNQYPTLSPAQQATVKAPLSVMRDAVNVASSLYLAYHGSLAPGALQSPAPPTTNQVSNAIASAQVSQDKLKTSLASAGVAAK